MKRSTVITIVVAVAFGLLLYYSTVSSQHVECTVTVEFNGMRNTATASGDSEDSALQQAQTTACGPMINGMNESIACSRTPPAQKSCKTI